MKRIENVDVRINPNSFSKKDFTIKNVKKNGEIVDIIDISGNTSKVVPQKYDVNSLKNLSIPKANDLEEIFKAINYGYEKLSGILDKKVVLVIGNTGSGKSTLVNYLTGKNLIADKPEKSTRKNEFHITSKDEVECKISHESAKSCTTIPNRDASTSNVYWDCPGFKDTRGFKQDIVNQFYINNIFNKIEDIKVLVVIDEATLDSTKGKIFDELVTTLNQMFKNSDEVLKQSCIFVFTKGRYENFDSLKNELQNGFIDNEKSDLSNETKKILSNVIERNLVVMFSKPEQKGTVDIQERDYILKILGNASYTSNPTIKLTLASDSLKETISLKKQVKGEIDGITQSLLNNELSKISNSFEELKSKLKYEFNNEKDVLDFLNKKVFNNTEMEVELDKIKYFHETVFENFFRKFEDKIKDDDKSLVDNVEIQIKQENKFEEAHYYNILGEKLLNLGQYKEAIKCYDKVIELDSHNSIGYNNKGFALHLLGKYKEAIECYDKAIEIQPEFLCYTKKGYALKYLGKKKESTDCLNIAVSLITKIKLELENNLYKDIENNNNIIILNKAEVQLVNQLIQDLGVGINI
jgi:GTPase Era involved in 16S rRNA processing